MVSFFDAAKYTSFQSRRTTSYLPDWPSCEQQLTKASQVFGTSRLPDPAAGVLTLPLDGTVKPLLHVPHPSGSTAINFDFLWGKVNAPTGYTKHRWDGLKANKRSLRLAPNKREYTEPVWLAFDPERGKGWYSESFWGQADNAASEVFSALIQFPEWSLAWFNGASAPNLSGYQLKYDGVWSRVPFLGRADVDRQLTLGFFWAAYRDDRWSSPSVRVVS